MKTDSPGAIIAALGEIDDQLALQANEHAELEGRVKSMREWLKTYEGALYDRVEGDSAAEKKERAKALLHDSDQYVKYLSDVKKLGVVARRFEYLDTRRSIGQSILKTMREEATYGQSAGQHGVGEE